VQRERVEEAIAAPSAELLAELEETTGEPVAAPDGDASTPAEPEPEPERPAAETPTPAAPDTPPATEAAPSGAPESEGGIVVLDVDRSWDRIARPGRPVETIAPDGMAGGSIGRIRPGHVIANLGAPRVLDTLIALRAEGCKLPFWGCVADAASGRALLLGRIEPATRPLDPDAVLGSLRPHAGKGTRVVTVGDDVDAFVSLRQAFARDGMSVSMAWNAKQAADLIPMVRPAVVILELDLPPADANGILGKLAVLDPLPMTVFVPATKERGRGLAGALADPTHRGMLVPIAEVLAQVTRAKPPARPGK